jgi:hypothetical protein
MRKKEVTANKIIDTEILMPPIASGEKANTFFHSVLHRRTEAMASKLGTEIPFISVFDGYLYLESNNNSFKYSVRPSGYDELKSLIHLICTIPFCDEIDEHENLYQIVLDRDVWSAISYLPDSLAKHMRGVNEELRMHYFDLAHCTTEDRCGFLHRLGEAALLVATHVGLEQQKLLEDIWLQKILPVIKNKQDQLIVIVGGNRSAEAGEIVTTFFQQKLSESIGVGASLERQVMFYHSPKTREEMKMSGAQRLVSRELGFMLFQDSSMLQRDILSGLK